LIHWLRRYKQSWNVLHFRNGISRANHSSRLCHGIDFARTESNKPAVKCWRREKPQQCLKVNGTRRTPVPEGYSIGLFKGGMVMSAESEAKVTTDHAEIQRWVDERGGHPARVKGTQTKQSAGVLRIDYPGFSGEDTLETISWQALFDAFEAYKLAFLYQDETKDGSHSRFSKRIDRDSAKDKSRAAGT